MAAIISSIWNSGVFVDDADTTKKFQFDASGVTTGTVRTITVPNVSGTIAAINISQTWSALQTFTDSVSIASSDAGSGLGPDLYLRRNSASPAASDNIGSVRFVGKDVGGTDTTYSIIYSWINDPANGAEKGGISVQTMQSGTLTEAVQITHTGNVGIGTTSPNIYNPLYNNIVIGTGIPASSGVVISGSAFSTIQFTNNVSGLSTHSGIIQFDHTLGRLSINPTAAVPFVNLFDSTSVYSGRVGIGTSTPGYTIDVNGSINATNISQGGTAIGTMATQNSNNVSITGGSITILDTNFTLQDNVDTTKKALFELNLLTTGTTNTYKLPAGTGSTFMMLDIGPQTVTGNTTFTNANGTFGNSTATGTISVATGATISGSTKTVNVGTGGAAGSTTTITIGPTAGAGTVTFGSGLTSVTIPTLSLTNALTVANGGTGATSASGARTNLGLGTIATQDASNVSITGGSINGTTIGGTTPAAGTFTSITAISTDPGSGLGPDVFIIRDSTSPAAGDNIGTIRFNGRDSGGNVQSYSMIYGYITDPTNLSEAGGIAIQTVNAGTLSDAIIIDNNGKVSIQASFPSLYSYNDLVVGKVASASGSATIVGSSIETIQFTNGTSGSATQSAIIQLSNGTGRFAIDPNGSTSAPLFTMFNSASAYNNRIGVNTNTPAYTVDVNGTLNASTIRRGGVEIVPTAYGVLQANYTLTSVTTAQKLFNWSTNGALTLPVGTYRFSCSLLITSMSTTSGSAKFDLKGAGTSVIGKMSMQDYGSRGTVAVGGTTALSGTASDVPASGGVLATAATSAALRAMIHGVFEVTTAGTIIPSISLDIAAAAIVNAGSFFECTYIGPAATLGGSWS